MHKHQSRTAAIAAICLLAGGCASSDNSAEDKRATPVVVTSSEQPPGGGQSSSKATPVTTDLDAEAFAELAAQGATVIDVRTPAEYAGGHIAGARNIDVTTEQGRSELAELDPAGDYAVYCRSGNRSGTAVELMRQAGISSVAHLDTGILGWEESGRPLIAR